MLSVLSRSSNPIDNMLRMLSEYTHNMEDLVKLREAELHTEKKQVEKMLYSILPRFIDSLSSLPYLSLLAQNVAILVTGCYSESVCLFCQCLLTRCIVIDWREMYSGSLFFC